MSKKGKSGVVVIFDPIAFQEKGFDGEIATYMREHKNTAIVGEVLGVDRHVIQFTDRSGWDNYKNPYSV